MRSLLLVAAACLLAGGAQAQSYKAPRTPNGAPDLQGLWTNSAITWLQRPPMMKGLIAAPEEEAMLLAGFKQLAGDILETHIDPNKPALPAVKEAPQADIIEMDLNLARIGGQPRTSWIVEPANGRLPFTDEGAKAARSVGGSAGFEGPEARPLMERCLLGIGSPEGPPMMNTGFNAHYQIVQTKDHVAIHIEMNHDVRIVRLGDRTHAPPQVRPWMGDSVGWWEGDTLVVETTNFDPRRAFVGSMGGGFAYSEKGKLIERFTRVSTTEILYRFEIDDPLHFKQVWKGEMPLRAARGPIYEYACHEGNYSLANALTGARVQEQEATVSAAAR